jgi:hypothetical protein
MAQQTAVEWLIDRYISSNEPLNYKHLEQAKEMEKQQIETAYKKGHNFMGNEFNPNQYYNETYGNESR